MSQTFLDSEVCFASFLGRFKKMHNQIITEEEEEEKYRGEGKVIF